jgi:hypothetical protein
MMTNLFPNFGTITIKSMEMLVKIVVGIDGGYNALGLVIVSPLFL